MKSIILIFAVGITLNTAGCAWKVPEFRKVPELTQEKKDFLAKMSVDEERVQNGKLYDWQVEALRQYDYAMGFLQEKYPSHTFKFTFYNPKGNVNPFSYFLFKADNKDALFNLYLYIDDNHTYSCKDNYYGELLKDSYNAAFLNFLQEYFPECIERHIKYEMKILSKGG